MINDKKQLFLENFLETIHYTLESLLAFIVSKLLKLQNMHDNKSDSFFLNHKKNEETLVKLLSFGRTCLRVAALLN